MFCAIKGGVRVICSFLPIDTLKLKHMIATVYQELF